MLKRQSLNLQGNTRRFSEQSGHVLRLIQDNSHTWLLKLAQFMRWEIEVIGHEAVGENVICKTASKETQNIGPRVPKQNN
jgi:hypothetical protein